MINNMTSINPAVSEAAALIATHNPALAKAFLDRPFARIDLACAFSRGLVQSETDDIHPHASLVMRVAILDRDRRKLQMEMDEKP